MNPPFESSIFYVSNITIQVHLSLLPGMQIESPLRHVMFEHQWPVRHCRIFRICLSKYDFQKIKNLTGNVYLCVFLCSCSFFHETFLLLGRIQQDVISKVPTSSSKEPDIFVPFSTNLNFQDRLK